MNRCAPFWMSSVTFWTSQQAGGCPCFWCACGWPAGWLALPLSRWHVINMVLWQCREWLKEEGKGVKEVYWWRQGSCYQHNMQDLKTMARNPGSTKYISIDARGLNRSSLIYFGGQPPYLHLFAGPICHLPRFWRSTSHQSIFPQLFRPTSNFRPTPPLRQKDNCFQHGCTIQHILVILQLQFGTFVVMRTDELANCCRNAIISLDKDSLRYHLESAECSIERTIRYHTIQLT